MGLLLWTRVEKTVYGVETHWFAGKKKAPGAVLSKEGDADSLLKHERTHH